MTLNDVATTLPLDSMAFTTLTTSLPHCIAHSHSEAIALVNVSCEDGRQQNKTSNHDKREVCSVVPIPDAITCAQTLEKNSQPTKGVEHTNEPSPDLVHPHFQYTFCSSADLVTTPPPAAVASCSSRRNHSTFCDRLCCITVHVRACWRPAMIWRLSTFVSGCILLQRNTVHHFGSGISRFWRSSRICEAAAN